MKTSLLCEQFYYLASNLNTVIMCWTNNVTNGSFVEKWACVAISVTVTLLIYHSHSLDFGCSSNEAEVLERSLHRVLSQTEALRRRHSRLVAAVKKAPWLINGSVPNAPIFPVMSREHGPAVRYEALRRRLYLATKELWHFVQHQLGNALREGFERQKGIMAAVKEEVAERKRWLLSLQEQLPLSDGLEAWRRREAARVGGLVQRRLRHLQHPPRCEDARKLICPYEWDCGFGCDIFYLASCLIYAYATERTLILNQRTWRYYGGERDRGWAYVFQPLSTNCAKNYYTDFSRIGSAGERDAKVVLIPASIYRRNSPVGIPLHYIPQDLVHRIMRFSSDPASWWVGQILKYILRPQNRVKKVVIDAIREMNLKSPIVGVHVRRTDKVFVEAGFHPLSEYMAEVEDYFAKLELTTAVDERRVYLATDDADVIKEATSKYPEYKFYYKYSRAARAGPSTRYSMGALADLLVDVYALAMCDYAVCTLSSNIGRTILGLMHTHSADVSDRFQSLDITTYNYRAEPLLRVAVMRNADIPFDIGDVISSYHWDCTKNGTVLRTGISGRIPWYKTEEQLVLYPFPKYEQVPIDGNE